MHPVHMPVRARQWWPLCHDRSYLSNVHLPLNPRRGWVVVGGYYPRPRIVSVACYRMRVMHAIETTGRIDERGSLRLDEELPVGSQGPVRVIILVPDIDEPGEAEWLRAVASNPGFADLADPREDVYTLEDGKPFVDAR